MVDVMSPTDRTMLQIGRLNSAAGTGLYLQRRKAVRCNPLLRTVEDQRLGPTATIMSPLQPFLSSATRRPGKKRAGSPPRRREAGAVIAAHHACRPGRHGKSVERRALRRLVARLGEAALPPHHRRARVARRRPLRALDRQSPPGRAARVLKECWRLGYVSAEDFQRAADLEPVRGSRLPRGRALQPGEVRALFAACEDDDRKKPAMAARDAAILALLYGSGLRRAEAVGLEVADYDREAGTLGNPPRNPIPSMGSSARNRSPPDPVGACRQLGYQVAANQRKH